MTEDQGSPLFYLDNTIEKVEGVRPYSPLELAGRDIYIREGCYVCHSQMIRPMRDEVEEIRPHLHRQRPPLLRQPQRHRTRRTTRAVLENHHRVLL